MWLRKTVACVLVASTNRDTIFDVIQELDATGYVDEIIVVDNGVDVETLKAIRKTRAKFISISKYGEGRAIKEGVKATKADLIITTKPDGSFKGVDISKLLSYSQEFDTVFGSRTHVPLASKNSGMTFPRRMVDNLFGKVISLLFFSSNLTDVGCAFRLTNKKGWKKIIKEAKSGDEIFFSEWLIVAAKNKVRFIEIPVNFSAPKPTTKEETFPYLFLRAFLVFYQILRKWIDLLVSKF